jgi:hypothetical protein
MTDPTTLLALAERCEQAVGPDRELDQDISRVLLPAEAEGITRSRYGWSYRVFGPSGWGDFKWLENLPFSASLDAAVTLVPEGHEWLRKNEICMTVYRAPTDPKEWARHIDARGATPALALCAAALRARAALGEKE